MQATINKHSRKQAVIGIIAFLVILFAARPVSAQGVAEVWLSKAAEKLRNKGTEISFRIKEEGVRISGKLLMDGEKFAYDTDEMKIWYDGTTQWTLQIGDDYNELYIGNPTIEDQQSINPYLLLNNYKENFTVMDGGEKSIGGNLTHMVTLKANNERQEINSLNIYITSDGMLSLLELVAPDGHPYKIEVRSMRNGLTFPKNTFIYQPENHPVDEVIDMR